MSAGLEVVAGRDTASNGMMTMGCSGLGCATAICIAQSVGHDCALCVRRGAFPAPSWWRGAGIFGDLARPSVQVLPIAVADLRWGVVAFVQGQYVDGRYPIIGAGAADNAIDLAVASRDVV